MPEKPKAALKRAPRNIEFRKGLWYVTLAIPVALKLQFGGKKRFITSLETTSEREALRRAPAIVASWRTMIDAAKGGDKVAARAAFYRENLRNAKSQEERGIIRDLIADEAEGLDSRDPSDPDEDQASHPDAIRFYKLATSQRTEMAPLVEPWLTERRAKDKTKVMDKQALQLLIEKHPTVEELTKRAASKFVSEVLAPGRNPATTNRMLTSIRSFWSWLEVHGYRPEATSIWAGLNRPVGDSDNDGDDGDNRRPFTEEEAAAFLQVVPRVSTNPSLDSDMLSLLATSTLRARFITAAPIGGRGAWQRQG
ncbi:DUF6538 domain-containing protein [Pseudoroseomonas wenyumeiae]